MTPIDALARLDAARARISRSLIIERLAPIVRVAVLFFAALGIAGLFGLWRIAHPALHAFAALAMIALTVTTIWYTLKAYSRPTPEEIDRRLAKESGGAAVIDGLDDRPAGGDLIAHAVWRKHQERLAERADSIGKGKSKGVLRALDPWRVRYLLLAAFAAGLFFGKLDSFQRLGEAYSPPWGALLGDGRLTFDVWATPPAYTGQSPIYLAGRAAAGSVASAAPEGSIVSVRIFGAKGAPTLVLRSRDGVKKVKFTPSAGAYEAKVSIHADAKIEVYRFGKRGAWKIRVIDDKAPVAVFVSNPKVGPDNRVSFKWRASDDFGVDTVWLSVRLVDPGPGPSTSNRDDIAIPLPSSNARELQASERLDVFAHQFAGLKVEARLAAVDRLGQRGESEPVMLTLPEKRFANPLARAIIEARRTLLRERRQYDAKAVRLFENDLIRIGRAPDGVKRSAKLIEAITLEPTQFFTDTSVFLGLKYALGQIGNSRNIQEAHVPGATLWAIALKVEYGDRAEAEMKLEAAREALKKAILDGADSKTLERLAKELQEAFEEAMEARAADALAKNEPAPDESTQEVQLKDIQKLIEEIKDSANRGDKGDAQQKLDKLGELMDQLQADSGEPGKQQQQGQNGEQGEQGKMDQAMSELGQAMDQQKQLADETFQKAQEGGGGGDDKMSKEQGDIAGLLAQAAGKTGKKPGSESLDAAGKAMRDAQQAIQKGDFGKAMGLQAEAMNQMRQGQAALSNSAKSASKSGDKGESQDPLGRQPGRGIGDGRGVNLPDFTQRERAQEILEEIKKRAAKTDNDPVERSYLDRLLERF